MYLCNIRLNAKVDQFYVHLFSSSFCFVCKLSVHVTNSLLPPIFHSFFFSEFNNLFWHFRSFINLRHRSTLNMWAHIQHNCIQQIILRLDCVIAAATMKRIILWIFLNCKTLYISLFVCTWSNVDNCIRLKWGQGYPAVSNEEKKTEKTSSIASTTRAIFRSYMADRCISALFSHTVRNSLIQRNRSVLSFGENSIKMRTIEIVYVNVNLMTSILDA